MPTETRGTDWSFLLAFMAGAVTGAAAALLAAPRSGQETRAQLRLRARGAGEKARELPEALRFAAMRAAQAAQESFAAALEPEGRNWTQPRPGESDQ
jgi:gas vesicle protein